MCGIGGILSTDTRDMAHALGALSVALRHRGPDGEGSASFPVGAGNTLHLAHRRLAIIDLTEAGTQPMRNSATGDTIVFNGEIYNYLELREELAGHGLQFESNTDTEVILKGYEAWGLGVLRRLRGMFAFALVDAKTGEILLARDHAGIKPLYYAQDPTDHVRFLFASEVRAMLASGLVPRRLDRESAGQFLVNGCVPDPMTIIRGVRSLLPGHYMVVEPGGAVRAHAPFESAIAPPSHASDGEPAARTVRRVLEEAIDQHVISDVPLGVFLSGGIDSSVLAALMARRGAEGVRTFSLVFDDPALSEEKYSRAVARRLGTEHTECRISESEFLALAEDGLGALDQPTTDGLNTYVVSRKCREAGLTVALGGTGGDELFGGYTSFERVPRALKLLTRLGKLPRPLGGLGRRAGRMLLGRKSKLPSAGLRGKLAALLKLPPDSLLVYHLTRMVLLPETVENLIGSAGAHALPPELTNAIRARASHHDDLLAKISVYEQMLYCSNQLLRDSDSVSMAVALELRVPLLDVGLLAAVERVAPSSRFTPGQAKGLLIEATRDILPSEAYERRKMGFVLPLGRWLAGGLRSRVEELLHDSEAVRRAGLDPDTTRHVFADCMAAGDKIYFTRPWALFVLVDWCERNGIE